MFVAAAAGLSFTMAEPAAQRPERATVCEREGAKFVGSKPRTLREWERPPKKVRDRKPAYPDLPPDTRGSGMWIGELLLDTKGNVSHIWTIRQPRLTRPFPAFNKAILDAVGQWQFEPFVERSQAKPICMTVSVRIDWRRSPKTSRPPSKSPLAAERQGVRRTRTQSR